MVVEFLLVVLGVFLAFQVDRWNDQRLFENQEEGYLLALSGDFAAIVAELQRAEKRLSGTIEAAKALSDEALPGQPPRGHQEFYELLGRAGRLTSILFVSRTYDSLIASGNIEAISDQQLRSDMAAFYARVSGQGIGQLQRQAAFKQNQVDPYLISNLDQVASMIASHPDAAADVALIRSTDHYFEVLDRPEFRSLMATKWHMNFDLRSEVRAALATAQAISEQIETRLGEKYGNADSLTIRE